MPEAVKLILDHHHGDDKPQLWFNYRSDDNAFWARNERATTRYEDEAVLAFDLGD